MSVELSIEPRDGYLRFELSGERVPGKFVSEIVGAWSRIAGECQAKGITRVLTVSNLEGPASDGDMYAIGSQLPRLLIQAGCAKAAVVIRDPGALSGNRFGEDVAVNRGLRLRIFADESSALSWLTA